MASTGAASRSLSFKFPLAAAIVVITLSRYIAARRRFATIVNAVPHPPTHPLLGNLHQILPRGSEYRGDVRDFLDEYAKDKGPLVVFWAFGEYVPISVPSFVPAEAEAVQELLAGRNMEYFEKGQAYDLAGPLLGNAVLSSSGEHWKGQRKALEPGFRYSFLKDHATPTIRRVVAQVVDKWSTYSQEPVDLQAEMLALATDVIGLTAFGYDFGGVRAKKASDAPLYDAFRTILKFFSIRTVVPPFLLGLVNSLPTELNRNYKRQIAYLDRVVLDVIKKRMTEENPAETDLISQLLKKDENGNPRFTLEEIAFNIKTFLFAGHDTTASALTWCFYISSTHPEVEEKLLAELATVGTDGEPTYEELEKLPYLNAFIKEILRVYPSAGFSRLVKKPISVAGYVIPADAEVYFQPTIIHRSEKYYKNAHLFNPDRWLGEEGKEINQAAYFPFSTGPRNCIGLKLAQAEMRTVLATLLPKFKFQHVGAAPYLDLEMTFVPKNVNVIITKREANQFTQRDPPKTQDSASSSSSSSSTSSASLSTSYSYSMPEGLDEGEKTRLVVKASAPSRLKWRYSILNGVVVFLAIFLIRQWLRKRGKTIFGFN